MPDAPLMTPEEMKTLAQDVLDDRVHVGDSVHLAAGELFIHGVEARPPDRVTVTARLAHSPDLIAVTFTAGT